MQEKKILWICDSPKNIKSKTFKTPQKVANLIQDNPNIDEHGRLIRTIGLSTQEVRDLGSFEDYINNLSKQGKI